MFAGVELHIYRNMVRNPNRQEVVEFKMIGLGRSLEAPVRQR
jgi:hypothetical protein